MARPIYWACLRHNTNKAEEAYTRVCIKYNSPVLMVMNQIITVFKSGGTDGYESQYGTC